MKNIEILSLPKIRFAHIHRADAYDNRFFVAEDFIEISCITEGAIAIETEGRVFSARKGDIICILRNKDTRITAAKPHCHHTVAAMVNWTFLNDLSGLYLPLVTLAENDTTDICHRIDSFIHKPTTSVVKAAADFLELLCEIDACNRKADDFKPPSELLYCERAKRYVQKNLYRPITQAEIAAHLGISPGYLCGIFKKTEDTTLMKYINKAKLESLKNLVDRENIHIYEAAAMYGYADPNYVSRLFKQLFGYNITDKPHTIYDMG